MGRLLLIAVAALSGVGLEGCIFDGDSKTTTSTAPTPTFPRVPRTPTVTTPTLPHLPNRPVPPQPGQTQPPSTARYPLIQQQAMNYVRNGGWVAGPTRGGPEIFIRQSREATTEQEPVIENVCEPEYDYDERRYTTHCHDKTRYRPVTKFKTVYVLSGPLSARLSNVEGAFAQATAIGASSFRRAP